MTTTNGVTRSHADYISHVLSDSCSAITPDRAERREQPPSIHSFANESMGNANYDKNVSNHVASCHQPNIIENEQYHLDRDNPLSLVTMRTKSHDNEIIDMGINTPNISSKCGDDVKLVSPPKLGNLARDTSTFFDSWSSPHSSGGMF